MHFTNILKLQFYQSGLKPLSTVVFKSATNISMWFDRFKKHTMLINMNEYFTGQDIFAFHPSCDAKYHLENSYTSFQVENVEENVTYLEYTSQTTIGGCRVYL